MALRSASGGPSLRTTDSPYACLKRPDQAPTPRVIRGKGVKPLCGQLAKQPDHRKLGLAGSGVREHRPASYALRHWRFARDTPAKVIQESFPLVPRNARNSCRPTRCYLHSDPHYKQVASLQPLERYEGIGRTSTFDPGRTTSRTAAEKATIILNPTARPVNNARAEPVDWEEMLIKTGTTKEKLG